MAAPSAFTVTPDPSDGAQATGAWTIGETDAEMDVYLRVAGGSDILFDRLPAGSTHYGFRGLAPSTSYVAGIAHRHPVTGDVSSRVEAAFTTSAIVVALGIPTSPTGWADVPSGRCGLAVAAAEFPSSIECRMRTETAVGSGIYGAWETVATEPAVADDWTRCAVVVPSARLRREFAARTVRDDGATPSAWTTGVVVSPWVHAPLPAYTGTPTLSVEVTSVADGWINYYVTAANPTGGVAPTITVETHGTSWEFGGIPGGVPHAAGTPVAVVNGASVGVYRPAFDTTAQAMVTFRATLPGGGSATIQRTVQNQVKTSFGPSAEVTATPGPTHYSIAYVVHRGTMLLSINGGTPAAPPASPISVPRTTADQTYTFLCTADGVTTPYPVSIPVLAGSGAPAAPRVEVDSLCDASASADWFAPTWTAYDLPSGLVFDLSWTFNANTPGGMESGSASGTTSGTQQSQQITGTSATTVNVIVKAHFNGELVATGAKLVSLNFVS
jgi:hypothetical protein